MVQLKNIEEIDLGNNSKLDSINKLPAPIFGMSALKKVTLTRNNKNIIYNDVQISSVRKEKMKELIEKIAMIDKLMDLPDFANMHEQLNVKKRIAQDMLGKLKEVDEKFEADKATSQAIISHSSYSKFGQFFKLMWSKFTESKLGRTLNLVRSYFFQH